MCNCKTKCSCKCEPVTDEQLQAAIAMFNRAAKEGDLEFCNNGKWYGGAGSISGTYRIKPVPVGPDELIVNVYNHNTFPCVAHEDAASAERGREFTTGLLGTVRYIRAPE